jgi:hypothetical protein
MNKNIKKLCVFPLGSWLESLIDVITFGWGKSLAGWVAWTFFRKTDCGCQSRKEYLDKLFNCENHGQIKL